MAQFDFVAASHHASWLIHNTDVAENDRQVNKPYFSSHTYMYCSMYDIMRNSICGWRYVW